MNAEGLSENKHFIKKVLLNGKQLDRNYITHNEILKGGNLLFVMCNKHKFADSYLKNNKK